MNEYEILGMQTVQVPYHTLTCQNAVAPFKQERISSTTGRALRSFRQHRSTVFHNSSLNPSRLAPSGFAGRIPAVIVRMTIIFD
jgi:hypothetical protein